MAGKCRVKLFLQSSAEKLNMMGVKEIINLRKSGDDFTKLARDKAREYRGVRRILDIRCNDEI
jgi:hypothetical protein